MSGNIVKVVYRVGPNVWFWNDKEYTNFIELYDEIIKKHGSETSIDSVTDLTHLANNAEYLRSPKRLSVTEYYRKYIRPRRYGQKEIEVTEGEQHEISTPEPIANQPRLTEKVLRDTVQNLRNNPYPNLEPIKRRGRPRKTQVAQEPQPSVSRKFVVKRS